MIDTDFTRGWTAGPKRGLWDTLAGEAAPLHPVDLPHDFMPQLGRSADAVAGAHSGYFHGGTVEYHKSLFVPDTYRDKKLIIEFGGVYRDAMVFVNNVLAAQRPNGYSRFFVDLDAYVTHGAENSIRVEARGHQDSRWYTGMGMHRDVKLHVLEVVHLAPTAVRVSTSDIDDERAIVSVATTVSNAGRHTVTALVRTDLQNPDGEIVASDLCPVTVLPGSTATTRQRLYVERPRLWSPDFPALYRASSRLSVNGLPDQSTETTFGIRSLQLDARRGLRINGRTTKLRGACIHHDNGILGARALPEAEERRVRILKNAGFNAIRSAHNPMSEAMLDACDRLGMLVMDEAFDVWTEAKSSFDYSLAFPEWWERDIEAMVEKDYNHPSVIFYSIGNEIPDTGTAIGSHLGRLLAEKVRSLDSSRFVTNAVNGLASILRELPSLTRDSATAASQPAPGLNDAMGGMADTMSRIDPLITARIEESLSAVDAAGLNYGESRYLTDLEQHPNRVFVGTETYSNSIAANWSLVSENDYVIGDFTWTGWDYLGEAGIGRVSYTEDCARAGWLPVAGPYPYLAAWCGDIDITGHRRPASYYREIVYGLRDEPYLAVRRPAGKGLIPGSTPWSWTDSVASWTWDLEQSTPVDVEIYSAAPEVELLLNDRSLGRRPTGPAHDYRTTYEVPYEPGTLTAVAFDGDREVARWSLRSAVSEDIRLQLTVEGNQHDVQPGSLLFIQVATTDVDGTTIGNADREVTLTVTGPASLVAFGSAAPATEEGYDSDRHSTFEGRALAIIRVMGSEPIEVAATSPELAAAAVTITSAGSLLQQGENTDDI
ncbi:beta-galactosidase [Kibdelosporangium banguiense]|uniref:Beta-galactosidase n=1 Tax=Kibdelosporangium banguiense TaxID=1365924 RepID=A0ABS4TY90_9PSEU|nr:glycoside hydrolase family 2 TIM barrel-domain containing protein [Kibdelosporangium banguiense]MBP2328988.1 beta-galactosidase [Kibdelosporangium banguiense]